VLASRLDEMAAQLMMKPIPTTAKPRIRVFF